MKIKINSSTNVIEVSEPYLEVKDKRLYNTVSKRYEGLDGDIASFIMKHDNGKMYEHRGTIEGYTCSGRIKFRGNDTVYEGVTGLHIDHVSVITSKEDNVVEYSLVFS
jgi:hypothetical protein